METIKTNPAVHNRGIPPQPFISSLISWARSAHEDIFKPNPHRDIYSTTKDELGPFDNGDPCMINRRAVMVEVLLVLAGFESGWNWHEGVDRSKRTANTSNNEEAGAWQVSYDARLLDESLNVFMLASGVSNAGVFIRRVKDDELFAIGLQARLLRVTCKHNGPLLKGEERRRTWPDRIFLQRESESVYPWLSRERMKQIQEILSN